MTTQKPVDVSAIVVTYNRNAPLRQTLAGLLKQDPAPKEILVIDQSRQHDEETSRFLKHITDNKQIRFISQPEPNAQKARNRAIKEASGEVLLFVDDDVAMDETLVGAHWKNYSDPELAAVCGYYTEPGSPPIDELTPESLDPLTGWLYFPHAYSQRTECYSLPTCNGSVRRQVAIQVGGFDENYTYTHFDDTDFSARLKELGAKAVHDPEARLIHLKEIAGGKRPGGINEYVIADSNRWYTWVYFFWMNFGWRGRKEILRRLRRTVFRKQNILRPWYLAIAFSHFVSGTARAIKTIRGGRRLGFTYSANSHSSGMIPPELAGTAALD
ncbi:MAG TPA: glycosyltransferase family 2 protein [Pyrinomonadaceae bacterium]|nr:glycosyltransferase family 2 protein [Pyrinomonadaceae bacterium]